MSEPVIPVEIPDKPAFKAAEVCELVQIPSYVLRTWENEFRDLGAASKPGAPRTYRRRDVELAFRIKSLVFGEHLTLAGVRRRLEQEHLLTPAEDEGLVIAVSAPASGADAPTPVREKIELVKEELRSLLQTLARNAVRAPAVEAVAAKGAARVARRGRADVAPALPGLGDEVAASQGEPQPASESTGDSERGRRRPSARRAGSAPG